MSEPPDVTRETTDEPTLSRRDLLKTLALAGAGAGLGGLSGCIGRNPSAEAAAAYHEAKYYSKLAGGRVQCHLCPNQCTLGPGGRGVCGNRVNRDGKLYTLVYGRAGALNVDPVEKKPLFHFKPGSWALSVGTAGCAFSCKNCQNWELSQRLPEQLEQSGRVLDMPPSKLVAAAKSRGIPIIAYTYNEPVSFYEYMLDTAKLARRHGIKSVIVSNGFVNREPMLELLPYLDAVKIDLKGFSEAFYTSYCAGRLAPVLETIKRVIALGKWLEIVYLVIPTVNDDAQTIRAVANWVKRAGGPDLPLHFSRFMPAFRLKNLPPTPEATLRQCRKIALAAGLNYVYVGNIPGWDIASTYCPGCGKVVIKRNGFEILAYNVKANGACKFCGRQIAGIFS